MKKIKDICTVVSGSTPKTNVDEYWDGDIKWITPAELNEDSFYLYDSVRHITELGKAKTGLSYMPQGTVILSSRAPIGKVAITQYDSYVDRTIAIFQNKYFINKRFFAYVLKMKFDLEKKYARGSTLKTITKEEFSKFKVPVPPMEVQCEIVHILDQFTLLTAELTAELTARRQQYEYYTKYLLSNLEFPTVKSLKELVSIKTGSKPEKILDEKTKFEYINAGTTNSGFVNVPNISGNVVTTPSRGQGGIGFVGYQSNPFWQGPLCYGITSNNEKEIITKYIYHYLRCFNEKILAYKKEGGTPAVNASDLYNIEIEYPSLEEQQRIVDILDKFDAYCNDLTQGLPAEIELRKQQYEYYRDKLLSFKELK